MHGLGLPGLRDVTRAVRVEVKSPTVEVNKPLVDPDRPGLDRSREAAAKAIQSRVATHDAIAVPVIREYRAMGMGYAAIADVLNLGEIGPPRGGFWTRMQVARICRRHGIKRG